MKDPKIGRVLISVTDKTGVGEFALALQTEFGAEIVSTGGTAKALEEAGVKVRSIDDLTGFPEMMDGRVKTLHPRVHGGLLARRDIPSHMEAAREHGIGMIDMVVVNLYAFEATVAKEGVTFDEAIENIDIGGPSMLRGAAKNHTSVTVVSSPNDYDAILEEMRANNGCTTLDTRKRLALQAYRLTAAYDAAISGWLGNQLGDAPFPEQLSLTLTKVSDLRYGENPHQRAAVYGRPPGPGVDPAYQLINARRLQGKALSYNNYLDLDAAWSAVREFEYGEFIPVCVIAKHQTPCGISDGRLVEEAYEAAYECDPVSAYGGVMAFNAPVSSAVIDSMFADDHFVEAIIAPEFEEEAIELLKEKPNIRVLATGGMNPLGKPNQVFRSIEGGVLVVEEDSTEEDPESFKVVTKRQPTDEEKYLLAFAWSAAKSVKSNAIVVVSEDGEIYSTVGIGGGQPNRVNSARIAVEQAGEKAKGAVAASDAFMPFADSLEVLIEAGVTAVIQTGGSKRDDEVIAAANKAGIAMVFTGVRHFRH
ncbi:MAG: bifunctional phosphoribosylaminoimidazolecarboxamide formyltransferase/IMP cyclohydrolase [Candidatus Nomurabacteria bacterium]|jgi:phosphoribosylaminoimidazolecarboxamide formyltransferase/IMP cyclohydrolase|nr:bifunctional phosphoribosylaminoimidazolecarboxamide formyltransferase/IMP cyclohydrolase [Candidatus Nomurabacteria bacterium]